MKVLILINSIDVSQGGTSRSSTAVVSELSRQFPHLKTTLITRSSDNPVRSNFEIKNADIKFCQNLALGLYQNFSLIRQADVIHVQGLWSLFPTLFGILAKLISGGRLIVSPRGMLESWSLQQGELKKKLALFTYQGYLFRLTDTFHVTAEEESKSLSIIVPNNRNAVIPNGIDTSLFGNADHLADSEGRTILFLSRIHQKKGLELLIDAWSSLALKWPTWKVRIVGDGDKAYIESLKHRITNLNLVNIAVEGPLYGEDKNEAYSSSDIFVLPTYSENFGIVVAEALASCVPVITTTGTPWSEIDTWNCGEYIEPDLDSLINALDKWMEFTPESRMEAGLKGKKLVQTKYSLASVAQSFEKLYNNYLV